MNLLEEKNSNNKVDQFPQLDLNQLQIKALNWPSEGFTLYIVINKYY